MQTIDVVIFSVVITFVSLSMAQNVLLNLSSDPAQVHAIHKIIMVLGLGAAGFSLFLFMADENKGLPLILTVLAIVGIGAFLQKLKKDRQHATASQKFDPSEMSVADMLAAARDEVSGKSESTSTASQKLDPSEMSVADILAAARDEVSGKSKATAPPVDEILAHCRKVDG
jgi:flagellar hook-basal body complex protein FliE